jgi:hypothetical protein
MWIYFLTKKKKALSKFKIFKVEVETPMHTTYSESPPQKRWGTVPPNLIITANLAIFHTKLQFLIHHIKMA